MIDKKPADYIVTQWLLDPQPQGFISKQSVPVHVELASKYLA